MKIVADIQQKPLDQAAKLDEIRRSIAQGSAASETAIQRLQRLSKKPDAPSTTAG